MHHANRRFVPALGLDFLTPLYDPLVALTTRERTFKRLLIAQAEVSAGQRVLDLGCGTGTLALWLKQGVPGATVVGIDADEKVLAKARKKAAHAHVEMRFDCGFSYELPYADGSFERVVSSLFFHHLPSSEKRSTLREAYRVLAPGGRLHVADWGKPNPMLRTMFYAVQILDGFENTRDHVEGRLGAFFEEAGFQELTMPAEIHTPLGVIALYGAVKT
jgi:ubiquinone/menaquinone biosynthesis C-methylase UbiE